MSQSEQKIVVLVADDEPSTLALVASHARSQGYKVLEASDGDLAWQLAHEHLPDLVVLDVMMPGMSGWEVCRKIHEAVSLAHTGVIMLTGIGENLNEMTSPLYGADAYLDKPFEFSKLTECIRDVLAKRKKAHTMGRPAETDRPSSRPPVKAGRSNGMILTTVAALAERAAARKDPRGAKPKGKAPAGPGVMKARPPVKAKAKRVPPASAKPVAKATTKAALKARVLAKPATKATPKAVLKAKPLAKPAAKTTAKAQVKATPRGKPKARAAGKKAAPRPVAKAARKTGRASTAKAAAKTTAKTAAKTTAKTASRSASLKVAKGGPRKATARAKAPVKARGRSNEGARA